MYVFKAHYTNMCTGDDIVKMIELLGMDDEKSIYLMAMGVAYDLKEKNELLSKVEFIAC